MTSEVPAADRCVQANNSAGRLRPWRCSRKRARGNGRCVAHRRGIRRANLRRKYGITERQYRAMFTRQGGVCAICGSPPKSRRLHTDHCHETGRVRGLLCYPCNRWRVGRAKARDAALYERISAYLTSDFDGRQL